MEAATTSPTRWQGGAIELRGHGDGGLKAL